MKNPSSTTNRWNTTNFLGNIISSFWEGNETCQVEQPQEALLNRQFLKPFEQTTF